MTPIIKNLEIIETETIESELDINVQGGTFYIFEGEVYNYDPKDREDILNIEEQIREEFKDYTILNLIFNVYGNKLSGQFDYTDE